MTQKREIDLDILRTFVVVSALVLHFNTNIYIGFLSRPSIIVQGFIFTVGGFFFFTAGYMARKIYFDRYVKDPIMQSKIIFIKGLKIFSLYVLYVFFMRVFTNTDIPRNIMPFLFDHSFFNKILFTFGLLFMFTPVFLFFAVNYKKLLMISVAILIVLFIGYDPQWPIPQQYKMFIDRKLFLYPFFSALVIYAVGFAISNAEINYNKNVASFRMTIFVLAVIFIHLFLSRTFQQYSDIVHNMQYFTLFESITPYLFLLVVRYLITINPIYKYLSSPYVLCVGILSLHFYVISNLLLGLLSLPKESEPIIKLLGLLGIGFLSYMFTFWRFGSLYEMKSLTRRRT